jgi:hypothetical protein
MPDTQQDGAREHYALPVRQLGKNFVKTSENAGWVVGHYCCPLRLTGYPEVRTCHRVIIPLGVSLKEIVAQQCYQTTEDFRLAFAPLTTRMPREMSHRTWRRIINCSENGGERTDPLDI